MNIKTYLLLTTALVFLISCGNSGNNNNSTSEEQHNSESDQNEKTEAYKIGDYIDNFSLKNIDDNMVDLNYDSTAKGYTIIFTCNHCPYSIAYEDRIIELDKKYKELGYPVIAINPNDPEIQEEDSYELMQERAKEKGFTFPYLFDEDQKVYPLFGATRTPHVFVVAKDDQGYQLKYVGAIDDNHKNAEDVENQYLENALDALIEGKEIDQKSTKAIGCSIKTKK